MAAQFSMATAKSHAHYFFIEWLIRLPLSRRGRKIKIAANVSAPNKNPAASMSAALLRAGGFSADKIALVVEFKLVGAGFVCGNGKLISALVCKFSEMGAGELVSGFAGGLSFSGTLVITK